MAAYSAFAQYYDLLTENVEYPKRADYLAEHWKRLGYDPGLTLDMACGTGSLTLELYRRGVDVYGVDASVEMLSEARMKCADAGADLLFLRQKMQDLDLYGTVKTAVCTLDSLNHLEGEEELGKAFEKVSFFMDPGGRFFFDVNTPYKHREVLGNHTFVYDLEQVYCVWQNRFHPASCRVDLDLDFFEREGKLYRRSREHFSEWAYPQETLVSLLERAGFGEIQFFGELSFAPPEPDCQRWMVSAKKIK